MDREQALATLAIGVMSASLFGSVARNDTVADSNIDVAVQLSGTFSTGGFDSFWQLEQLEKRLSHLFGCHVDVVAEPVKKTRLKNEIDRDRVLAF